MLMMKLRNLGCNPASFLSLTAMGLLKVLKASVPNFNNRRTITWNLLTLP